MEPGTITIPEAAAKLGISRISAYKAAQLGQLPVLRIGKRLVVPKAPLERILAGSPTEMQTPGVRRLRALTEASTNLAQ